MKTENILLLNQLLLQYAGKIQEIGGLFRAAQADGGRDVTDAEVDASSMKRDFQIAKTDATVGGTP